MTRSTRSLIALMIAPPMAHLLQLAHFQPVALETPSLSLENPPTDPLASQGALILSDNNKFFSAPWGLPLGSCKAAAIEV